jgi:hypothetical protein
MERALKYGDSVGASYYLRSWRLEATNDSELDVEGDKESVS